MCTPLSEHLSLISRFLATVLTCRESAARLRAAALQLEASPKRLLEEGYAPSSESYAAEIQDAKYCLVIRCDDPQTSRFVDSLAAGCIPVIVNDLFLALVAPFYPTINYAAFAVFIPEAKWLQNAEAALQVFALNDSPQEQAMRVAALLKYRDALLWSSPLSTTAQHALEAARSFCMPEGAPAASLPRGEA